MIKLPFADEVQIALEIAKDIQPLANRFLLLVTSLSVALIIIHILITILLCLLLTATIFLIISVNPNLTEERDRIVTPAMKWVTRRFMQRPRRKVELKEDSPPPIPKHKRAVGM